MIRYKDTILEDFFIDPITAIITNSKGEIQETKINECGRPCFHCMEIHKIQVHTHLGYKKGFDIHHLDHNKMNNSLSNLVYLTKSEHSKLHKKGNKNMFGKHHSEETKQKMSKSHKGNTYMLGKHHTEETKQKIGNSSKVLNKDRIWINNGVENRFIHFDEDIPEGFIKGRLKRKIS